MKRLTLLSLALFCAFCSIAQPTLTGTTINPVAGERFYSHLCDTTGVSIGASGGPVTWDMTALASIYDDSTSYIACAGTPYCDTFPGSTLAVDYSPEYDYYITDANKFAVNGYGMSPNSVYFQDPEDYIAYPMTYSTTVADTVISSQPADSAYSYAIDSLIGDAYGTLKLPSGTFTNVLRVHLIAHSVDSTILGGMSFIDSSGGDAYIWWAAGFHNPLLLITYDTSGGTRYISEVIYYNQMLSLKASQIADSRAGTTVYPNPVKDEAHVTFYASKNEAVTITATDMMGRTMGNATTENAAQGMNDINYNVSSLAAGMYLLRIQTPDNTVLKKIVKTQ